MTAEVTKKETEDVGRKTLKERAEKLMDFLKEQNKAIFKSELSKIGFGNTSTDKWIELLLYLQKELKTAQLEVIEVGRYTTIQLLS